MGVLSSKGFQSIMKSDYSSKDLDVQQENLTKGNNFFDAKSEPTHTTKKYPLKETTLGIDEHARLSPLGRSIDIDVIQERVDKKKMKRETKTHMQSTDKNTGLVINTKILETTLTRENKNIFVKNKKRRKTERKPEGNGRLNNELGNAVSNSASSFKASPFSQKDVLNGDNDELVHCDGYIIHCLNDRRHIFEAEKADVSCKTKHNREELDITMRVISDGTCYKDPIHIFNVCVQNGYSLCCRYIFKCNQWIYSIPSLIEAFKKSIGLATKTSVNIEKAKHVDTAKAIAWQISRMFYLSQQISSRIKNIYPAFKCICEKKSSKKFFCSDILYIVVVVVKYIPNLQENYQDIPIYQKLIPGMYTEGERIKQKHEKLLREQSRSVCLLHGVSSKYAHQFFSDHSNVFSIFPALLRSKGFKINKNRFTVEKCVTFSCGLKGFIPIGERHFPDSVYASDGTKVQTDVIEGTVNLANLIVGDHIESSTMSGTLGGMLLYYNRNCFVTCAHVMLDEQSMISRKSNSIHNKDLRVFVKDTNGHKIECGNALRCDFETGSDTKSGVDVAIIEMNAQSKINPNYMVLDEAKNPHSHLYLGMSNEYLNDNCIDYELLTLTHSEVETMAFGQVTTVENCKTQFEPERMIEVELKNMGQAVAVANGNPTFPVMIAQPAHFQISQGSLPVTSTFRMYNQLCLNIPLVPGDSGTCIYIRNCPYSNANEKCKLSDKNGKCPHSGCLGMAIAFSNGMSIVTPLKKIFEHIL